MRGWCWPKQLSDHACKLLIPLVTRLWPRHRCKKLRRLAHALFPQPWSCCGHHRHTDPRADGRVNFKLQTQALRLGRHPTTRIHGAICTTQRALINHLVIPVGYTGNGVVKGGVPQAQNQRFSVRHSTSQIEQDTTRHACEQHAAHLEAASDEAFQCQLLGGDP